MHRLTTAAGAPVADNQNTQTAGPRGPALLQDVWFLEKLAHFDREVIPERRMHAKGAGAYGTFTVTHDITPYTRAKLFAEAGALIGTDRESHLRDLYDSIERGDFSRWTLYVQLMPEREAATCPYNPFDLTKVWPHADYPLREVGVLELHRNPDNHFAEVEQAAFNPAHVVPGIGFSPDRMLQGRLFSYGDAARYRLGVNHHLIPVNAPRCPVHSYHRDGQMRVDGNMGGATSYEPNSRGEWVEQPDFSEPPLSLEGAADHWNHRVDDDYFSQPRALFHKMSPAQRQALFENTARSIAGASAAVKARHIDNCTRCDPEYGDGVARAIAQLAELR